MNKQIFAYTVKNEGNPENFLDVNNAGILYATDSPQIVNRPNGRNDYLLVYTYQGAIKLHLDNKELILKNHFIIFKPHESQCFEYLEGPHHEYYWIHFNGVFVPKILEQLHINEKYYPVNKISSIPTLFEEIISLLRSKHKNYSIKCNYKFLKLLTLLTENSEEQQGAFLSTKHTKLAPALNAIQLAPQNFKTIKELADLCFLSPSTFIKLFTNVIGVPPITYLNGKKLERSLYFLLESDYNIHEIALECGFDNQFYYSKKFKQHYHCSPSQYKKKYTNSPNKS